MKKFACLVLALAMVFSLSISASAADRVDNGVGDEGKDVTVKVTEGTSGTVYNITVAWGSLDFVYKRAAAGTWDTTTHTYSGGNAAGWQIVSDQLIAAVDDAGNYTAVSSAITVVNHSNAKVSVSPTLEKEEFNGVALSLTHNAADNILENAAEVAYADVAGADQIVYTLKVSGSPADSFVKDTVTPISKITITIAAA